MGVSTLESESRHPSRLVEAFQSCDPEPETGQVVAEDSKDQQVEEETVAVSGGARFLAPALLH